MSIKNLLLVNLGGFILSILSKNFIKDKKIASFVSNAFLYSGTIYFFSMLINKPKHEEEQKKIAGIEEVAKSISSKKDLKDDFIGSEIKNENISIQTALNSSGIKIESIELLNFKTRDEKKLKTVEENSSIQISLYNDKEEGIAFKDFSKTKDGFQASNADLVCSYNFSTDDKYKGIINIDIKNNTKEKINLSLKGVTKLIAQGKSPTLGNKNSVEPIYNRTIYNSANWILIPIDYWATCISIPCTKIALFDAEKDKLLFFESEKISIEPETSKTLSFSVISLPMNTETIEFYESNGINNLSKSISYSLIGKVKAYFSRFIEKLFLITGSHFLTILIFIVILKLVTLYFDYFSHIAGGKLGRIMEIAKFNQNPQLFQQEIFKNIRSIYSFILYKYIFKSFLFIISYQVFSESIIFYKAPFLWIKDLSVPDQISTAKLFSFFPNNFWFIPKINLLSIIILFLFLGLKINLQTLSFEIKNKGQAAQKIPTFMLLIMLILFSTFPAIVCLYTVFNNALDKLQNQVFDKIQET